MIVPDVVTKRLPLLSLRVRGGWQGSKIFQVRRNKQYVRTFTDYDKSAKVHLSPFQAAFREGVSQWHGFSPETKRFWDARAIYLKKHCSGFNMFLSVFLKAAFRG